MSRGINKIKKDITLLLKDRERHEKEFGIRDYGHRIYENSLKELKEELGFAEVENELAVVFFWFYFYSNSFFDDSIFGGF